MPTISQWIEFLRAYNVPDEEIEAIIITYMRETIGEAQLDCCAFFKAIYDFNPNRFYQTVNANGYNAFLNANPDFTAACVRPSPSLN